jgi:uncharacterized protein (TIGR02652 family)
MTDFFSPLQYPFFGSEINCPHCDKQIPALILTDAYLCNRHGAFEVESQNLVHLQSGRSWQRWEDRWYRQHTHPDSLIAEIQDALDDMYRQGWRVTKIAIAQRYQDLISPFLNSTEGFNEGFDNKEAVLLFGVSLEFKSECEIRWQVINFELIKQQGIPSAFFNLYITQD